MINEKLNRDIDLNNSGYGFWDVSLNDDGFVFIDDVESLQNGIIITILTKYHELMQIPTYKDFGCRVHEMIKTKQTKLNEFKIKTYIQESVEAMNRIQSVEDVQLTYTPVGYHIEVYATSISGIVNVEVEV